MKMLFKDFRIVCKKTDECCISDNERYNEWQWMTMSGTTSDNEWQRVTKSDNECYNERQRVTTNDNEWPFRLIFFQIREESTTKHPKENSLNIEEDI